MGLVEPCRRFEVSWDESLERLAYDVSFGDYDIAVLLGADIDLRVRMAVRVIRTDLLIDYM
jgi:hypothetical protein